MKQAVIFGAGNIGRGFIGQLFNESGYQLVLVDIDQPLLDAINDQHEYMIHLVDNDYSEYRKIYPALGINSNDKCEVIDAFCRADLGATAVGARVLPTIAPLIALGIEQRHAKRIKKPINLIVCENLKNAASYFRDLIYQHLPSGLHGYAQNHLGLVDTVIGRMVPPPTPEMRAINPALIVVEPYKELPVDRNGFIGKIPRIVGMEASDHFYLFTARKLYIHNCGHAILAYLGYIRNYEYGYQALADSEIYQMVLQAMHESKHGIVSCYHAQEAWLELHINDLLKRFANKALGDTIFRLGRDPIRKLAPDDRLVAPARLALQAGRMPEALSLGIAAAYCFNPPQDPLAQQLQKKIEDQGIQKTLIEISAIQPDEPLGKMILEKYKQLRNQQDYVKNEP